MIAVTGGSGFLGRTIVKQAHLAGIPIRPISRAGGMVDAVPAATADVVTGRGLADAFRDAEVVIHAAGLAHRNPDHVRVDDYLAVNATACRRVVEAASAAGARRVVLISSISVYGGTHTAVADETTPPAPIGPYGTSKLLGEHEAIKAAQDRGLAVTILRMATGYGAEDPGNLVRLIRMVAKRRLPWIGQGATRKTLIHREDAARACLVAALASEQTAGLYNLTGGIYTMRDIVSTIAELLRIPSPRISIPSTLARAVIRLASHGGSPGRAVARTLDRFLADEAHAGERFCKTFAYTPTYDLRAGLAEEIAWLYPNRV